MTSEEFPAANLEPTDTPTLILLGCGALMILATFLLSPGLADLIEHLRSQIESEASSAGGVWEWIGAENLGKVLVTAPSLMVVLLALPGGVLVDRLGRRPFLLVGLTVFGLFGVATGLVSSIELLIACRIGSGIGLAAILLSTQTLLGDFFDGRQRRRVLGWQLTAVSVLAIVALFAAAFMVAQFSWRAPMAIYGLSLVMLPLAWNWVPEPSDAEKAGDEPQDGNRDPESEQENDSDSSSIPWAEIGLLYTGIFFALAFHQLGTTQIPGYLDKLGYSSPYATAGILATMMGFGIPSSLLFRRVNEYWGGRKILLSVFALGAIGFAVAGAKESILLLVIGLVIFSLPYGWRTPAFSEWLLDISPGRYRGRLTGGMTMATFAGVFCSPIISTPLQSAIGIRGVLITAAILQLIFTLAFGYFAIVRKDDK